MTGGVGRVARRWMQGGWDLFERLGIWPPLLGWMLLIYLFSDRPDIPQVGSSRLDFVIKKGLHALAYGILAGLWWRALTSLALRRPRLWAFAASLAYAASDEWHQRFVPGRLGQARDVLIDGLGAAAALLWIARCERGPNGTKDWTGRG